ncbi:hypothetical protein [Neobacillus sp. LXY-1]
MKFQFNLPLRYKMMFLVLCIGNLDHSKNGGYPKIILEKKLSQVFFA